MKVDLLSYELYLHYGLPNSHKNIMLEMWNKQILSDNENTANPLDKIKKVWAMGSSMKLTKNKQISKWDGEDRQ